MTGNSRSHIKRNVSNNQKGVHSTISDLLFFKKSQIAGLFKAFSFLRPLLHGAHLANEAHLTTDLNGPSKPSPICHWILLVCIDSIGIGSLNRWSNSFSLDIKPLTCGLHKSRNQKIRIILMSLKSYIEIRPVKIFECPTLHLK